MQPGAVHNFDVTVIGGGLAGLSACLHLAKAGFRVVCIEPEGGIRQPVGESLDWASPALLGALGLDMEELVHSGVATYKQGVTLQMAGGEATAFKPAPWVAEAPFHIALRTIHVDRMQLDRKLQDLATQAGVTVVQDRATAVERTGMRIAAIQSASGARFQSQWFIDASGSFTSLLAREFTLPAVAYGPRKVCLWSYFAAPQAHAGTTIYLNPAAGKYQDWIWEIPIAANTLSVGYVTTGDAVKQWREQGLTVEEILTMQLGRFPRLAGLPRKDAGSVPRVTSFSCHTYRGVAGPNWVIAGEAASMVDPITSNGVTSALRLAQEASELIAAAAGRTELPFVARQLYSRRVLQMGTFFNSGIETLVYDWPARDLLGMKRAATIYTTAAWSMNGLYSRLAPRGVLSTLAFGALLNILRTGAWIYPQFRRLSSH